jgi:hypothetical protein
VATVIGQELLSFMELVWLVGVYFSSSSACCLTHPCHKKVKVMLSLSQTEVTHRVMRRRGSHIF